MSKQVVIIGLALLGLAGFAAFAGWAFYEAGRYEGGWRSLGPIWPYAAGGVLLVGVLSGFFMWLAFYSANHGYDDQGDGR
jgi:hypothetical protein